MNGRKILRQGLTVFLIVIFLLSTAIVGAAVEIFDGAGQYIMSDFENHEIAKQRAQQRAERDAQKKAGVALKTFSRSINSELADDEVSAVINNIVKISEVKIVPIPFEAEGEAGIIYRATLKATIETDGIYDWLKRDDKEKVTILNQNKDLQDAIAKNDKQIEDLKEQYKQVTSQAEKDKLREQIKDVDRDFLANQKNDAGLRLLYDKDYNGAIKTFNEVLELDPYNYKSYNNRGCIYDYLGQHEKAIKDYSKSIELNPNEFTMYINRGLTYHSMKQYKLAIQDFDKAIQLKPNFYVTYTNRANVYFDQQQYERAIQDFDKAIELNPNDYFIYFSRGCSYCQIKNYKKAINDFDNVLQLNPEFSFAYQLRGLCYQQLGDTTKAKADLAKAKEFSENS